MVNVDGFEEAAIYRAALKARGEDLQTDMLIEEMAELTQAIIKYRRGKVPLSDVIEEMADVQIMINQLLLIVGEDEFREYIKYKLERVLFLLVDQGVKYIKYKLVKIRSFEQ